MFFVAPKGRITAIKDVEETKSLAGVRALGILVKAGDLGGDFEGQQNRAGYVVTAGESRDEAVTRAISFDIEE